ncbi:hypothetical protein K7X08_001097 [Anisodus acutangulus]|uniref:Glucan endo-1,3-beta-D-glucosidase n=1 Tax=Anisodus acutangulus TaxID=402998 RepID=A0A9Q1RN27_9SOLA|nr:hypothetical protein K7X08_001097 [Anisodus acutangulus]
MDDLYVKVSSYELKKVDQNKRSFSGSIVTKAKLESDVDKLRIQVQKSKRCVRKVKFKEVKSNNKDMGKKCFLSEEYDHMVNEHTPWEARCEKDMTVVWSSDHKEDSEENTDNFVSFTTKDLGPDTGDDTNVGVLDLTRVDRLSKRSEKKGKKEIFSFKEQIEQPGSSSWAYKPKSKNMKREPAEEVSGSQHDEINNCILKRMSTTTSDDDDEQSIALLAKKKFMSRLRKASGESILRSVKEVVEKRDSQTFPRTPHTRSKKRQAEAEFEKVLQKIKKSKRLDNRAEMSDERIESLGESPTRNRKRKGKVVATAKQRSTGTKRGSSKKRAQTKARDFEASIGVCYGRVGTNLPPISKAINLIKSNGISRIRLFNPDPEELQPFSGTGIELLIGVPNEILPTLANNPVTTSIEWLQSNIFAHVSPNQVKYLVVGNEIFLKDPYYSRYIVPTITKLYQALQTLGLATTIKLSSSHASTILSNSYPPSSSTFDSNIKPFLLPLLQFLRDTGSPLMVNVYPFFAYINNPKYVSLDRALFRSSYVEYDQNLAYDNMFDASIDAFVYAMEKEGFEGIPVMVTETGWPTAGIDGASIDNAFTYIQNIVRRALNNVGTPKRPGVGLDIFLFDLFDENGKSGEEFERHFGIFGDNGIKAYDIRFN